MNPLYDDPELAASYARVTSDNVWNAAYERPALRALVGHVRGLDVLDAGCAAGEHAAWFSARGARVTAVDVSEAMIALARDRLGDGARVVRADLRQRLPFEDDAFDRVVSSLALHYLEEWPPTLREFRRVLRPGGRLVFSTHHPFLTLPDVAAYREVVPIEERWSAFGDDGVAVRFYHRPLERIVGDVVAAGFVLRALVEPGPTAEIEARAPDAAANLRKQPWFLLIDATTS